MPDFGKYVSRLPAGTPPELARALADVFRDIVEDKKPQEGKLGNYIDAKADYGARGDGVTDDTASLQAAINAAAGYRLVIPAGTYIVSALTGVSNVTIEGDGIGVTIIKRKNSAASNSVVEFNAKSNFTIRNLSIDGNKANQTVGANTLAIYGCGSYTVENVRVFSAKSASGYGDGVALVDGTNDSTGGSSWLSNVRSDLNDGAGFYVNKDWRITLRDCYAYANGGNGLSVANNVFPPSEGVQRYINVLGGIYSGNTGSGIAFDGYYTGGSAGSPVFWHTTPPTIGAVICGVTCEDNTVYGIAYQAANGAVTGNVVCLNGNSSGGGILLNAWGSTCVGNTIRDNSYYGIDAGGSVDCVIDGNQIMWTGVTSGNVAADINIGASTNCVVNGNSLVQSGSNAYASITAPGVDGDGIAPFLVTGSGARISNNSITLNGVSGSIGIYSLRQFDQLVIEGNRVSNTNSSGQSYVLEASGLITSRCHDARSFSGGSPIYAVASASTMVIPDAGDIFFVTGTTTIDNIRTYSSNVFNQAVRHIPVTNQGSGYSRNTPPTIAFSGGGGSSAAATADVSYDGKLVAWNVTNIGSGYTSAPTGTITHNGGSGATIGTIVVGCNNFEGREITLIFQNTVTVNDGGNLSLNGNLSATSSTVLRLVGAYGSWYEISRTTS